MNKLYVTLLSLCLCLFLPLSSYANDNKVVCDENNIFYHTHPIVEDGVPYEHGHHVEEEDSTEEVEKAEKGLTAALKKWYRSVMENKAVEPTSNEGTVVRDDDKTTAGIKEIEVKND